MLKANINVAAVGDLHCTRSSHGKLQHIFEEVADRADVLALCGDLTDFGIPEEARILVAELSTIPAVHKIAVLGNHDFESGHPDEIRRILCDGGIQVLDGEAVEIMGVGFAGAKGFGGGFGRRMLAPWGEPVLKAFVNEGVSEAMKLESALTKLTMGTKVVLLHYSPIKETILGEPQDIFPYLGCSRLEDAFNRHGAYAVFHGHAHHGSPEGVSKDGIPVYNVAMPLLRRTYPDSLPVRFLTVPVVADPADVAVRSRAVAPQLT